MTTHTFHNIKTDSPDALGIVTVSINRTDAKNALDTATITALGQCLDALADAPACKAVVLTAEGKVFGIGADIPEIKAKAHGDELQHFINDNGAVYRKLEKFPKPTCAAINGIFCLGGSFELTLCCHFRVASKKVMLGLPEVSLGLIPGYGGTQRLARLVGKGRALELVLSGEPIRSEAALQMGLINREAEPDTEVAEAKKLLEGPLKRGPLAVQAAIRAVVDGLELPLADGLALERQLFSQVRATKDADEGLTASLSKRKPAFKGE